MTQADTPDRAAAKAQAREVATEARRKFRYHHPDRDRPTPAPCRRCGSTEHTIATCPPPDKVPVNDAGVTT